MAIGSITIYTTVWAYWASTRPFYTVCKVLNKTNCLQEVKRLLQIFTHLA